MKDQQILELYFQRSEAAIAETAEKYGKYCFRIAYNILEDREDSQESVNDTYLAAWNHIPPRKPQILATFLGKITRNLSLNRWKSRRAYKRGGGEVTLALEELGDCVSTGESAQDVLERKELLRALNRFLADLPETERKLFVCRYWYLESIHSLEVRFGFSESKVKSMLYRTRGKLRRYLEKEGLQ